MSDIREHARTDYQYRATVSHADLAEAMKYIFLGIDYSNFKNTIASRQGKPRAHVYGKVWNVLWELTEKEKNIILLSIGTRGDMDPFLARGGSDENIICNSSVVDLYWRDSFLI